MYYIADLQIRLLRGHRLQSTKRPCWNIFPGPF